MRIKLLIGIAMCSAATTLPIAGCSSSDSDAGKTNGDLNQAGSGPGGSTGAGGSSEQGQSGANSGSGGETTGAAGAHTGTGGGGGLGGGGGRSGDGGATTTDSGAGTGGAGGMGMGGPAGMSSGCGKVPTIPSNMYNNGQHIAITAANMQREYILNVPANYSNTHAYKLVIAYHELNGNDDEMYRNKYYHLLPLSNDSTIFVAPNGQQNKKNCTQASGCGWPNPDGSDMQLADAVVAKVEQDFCIDTNRIFATGWSFGGSMSYETACERPLGAMTNGVPGFIRAIAVYSGSQLSGRCKPSKPVAYYASHGTHDSVLPYNNGVGLAQNYAMASGCTWMTPTSVTSGDHVCTNLMGCMTGYPEQFCSFNGDHTPDPRDPNQQTSWEYQNVWTFFSQF